MSTTVRHIPSGDWLTRCLTGLGLALVWLVLAVLSLWAMAALYIDVRLSALRLPLTILYAVILVVILAQIQTTRAIDALMLRMFLPGARLVAEPEAHKYRSLAGRRG